MALFWALTLTVPPPSLCLSEQQATEPVLTVSPNLPYTLLYLYRLGHLLSTIRFPRETDVLHCSPDSPQDCQGCQLTTTTFTDPSEKNGQRSQCPPPCSSVWPTGSGLRSTITSITTTTSRPVPKTHRRLLLLLLLLPTRPRAETLRNLLVLPRRLLRYPISPVGHVASRVSTATVSYRIARSVVTSNLCASLSRRYHD